MAQENTHDPYRFLRNAGTMGELIINYDWTKTSLGSVTQWPQSLLTTLGNLLHSEFPHFLFWGLDLLCFYNDAYRPSLGHSGKHPAIGKAAVDVWPEIWSEIHPLITNVMANGKAVWFENRLLPIERNNKLEDVYWTFCYSPAFSDNGEINGVLVTCLETTRQVVSKKQVDDIVVQQTNELKQAHDSVMQAYEYLQKLINLFKEPLQVLEPVIENGVIVDFIFKLTNDAYAKYASATPKELHDKRVGEVFPGYFQTSSFTSVVNAYNTGQPDTWEIHYDQDGLDLYNRMSATKFDNEVVVHFTDFTSLKHLQLELIKKISELERSNQNLQDFAHAASHDLKEPIRKIRFFADQLRHSFGDQVKERDLSMFNKIETATERMSTLIDDLIRFSYVTTETIAKENIDLTQTLKHVLEELELHIQQKHAVIHIDPLPHITGHDRQLKQLFQNLVANALKYSKDYETPEINIRHRIVEEGDKKYCAIIISDNGIGFDPKFQDKIFELFARLNISNAYKGSGIGLSIAKKIVDNHDGKIRATGKLGEGATFEVLLPMEN